VRRAYRSIRNIRGVVMTILRERSEPAVTATDRAHPSLVGTWTIDPAQRSVSFMTDRREQAAQALGCGMSLPIRRRRLRAPRWD
jgi:hypothetical protein